MNGSKVEEDLFHHHLQPITDPSPLILDHDDHHHHHDHQHHPPPEFCLPPMSEFDFFRDEDEEDSISHTPSDAEGVQPFTSNEAVSSEKNSSPRFQYVNPEPHISSQFYTFNLGSHSLMIRCILDGRLATPDEIRAATPHAVLSSWRSVWKDRNEDTAYLTGWKRIQDKLSVHVGEHVSGSQILIFAMELMLEWSKAATLQSASRNEKQDKESAS